MMSNIFIEHEELIEYMLEHLAAPFVLYFYETVVSSEDMTYKKEVSTQGLKLIDNLGDYM
jgi:hypothetical protein